LLVPSDQEKTAYAALLFALGKNHLRPSVRLRFSGHEQRRLSEPRSGCILLPTGAQRNRNEVEIAGGK